MNQYFWLSWAERHRANPFQIKLHKAIMSTVPQFWPIHSGEKIVSMFQLYYNSSMSISGRIMGIDYGEKRVGIASTDEMGQFALPRVVLENSRALSEEVLRLAREWETSKIVIGESRNFKGEANRIHTQALQFAEGLKESGIEVVFHPELLTSVEARHLQGENDMLDASAAALILKSYLDTNK